MSVIKFPEPPRWRSVGLEGLAHDLSEGQPVDPCHIIDLANDIYYEIDELRAMIGAPPRRPGGRPLKAFVGRLAGYGGGWLATHGVPNAQADLERALLDECERRGWEYAESSARELAAELIAGYRDSLK